MRTLSLLIFLLGTYQYAFTQLFGPQSPNNQNTIVPGNNWSGPSGILNSDNNYSTVNAQGLTRSIRGRNYGFSLVNTDQVVGIQLDIERKSFLGADVAILNAWQDGELSNIPNFPVSAGNNRLMLVFVGTENKLDEPLVSDVTYNGVSMTKLNGFTFFTTFWGAHEVWYMLESQLSSIPIGSHNVQVSYSPLVRDEFFDIVSAVVLENVDQFSPFESVVNSTYNGGASTCNFTSPITAGIGGAFVTSIFCGNPPSGGGPNGSTNNFTINSGFTEGTDVHRNNTTEAPNSGGTMQTAFKLGTAGGTENPTITFNGSPNRRLLFGLGLRKATAVDNIVQLQKAGVSVGNNYANTTLHWPLNDTYATYGGPADLWGTTWTYADINSPNFGSVLKADVFNGGIDVDHMQITVYTLSTLPVELIDFTVNNTSNGVNCIWYTATELNSSHFLVERSINATDFDVIGRIEATGNSQNLMEYDFLDANPLNQVAYYRLKMIDTDGSYEYSEVKQLKPMASSTEIFPNPTSDWVNILSPKGTQSITITNQNGQIIDYIEGNTIDLNHQLNLQHEPDGVYYIITETFEGKEIQKLIKSRN